MASGSVPALSAKLEDCLSWTKGARWKRDGRASGTKVRILHPPPFPTFPRQIVGVAKWSKASGCNPEDGEFESRRPLQAHSKYCEPLAHGRPHAQTKTERTGEAAQPSARCAPFAKVCSPRQERQGATTAGQIRASPGVAFSMGPNAAPIENPIPTTSRWPSWIRQRTSIPPIWGFESLSGRQYRKTDGRSSSGRTPDFDSGSGGSNPSRPANPGL